MRANVKMDEASLLDAQLVRRLQQASLPEPWQPMPDYEGLLCWIVLGLLVLAALVVAAVMV